MPSLNEGSFLLMPTSMPHSGIEQNLDYIEALDKRLASIPEVETAIGKMGPCKLRPRSSTGTDVREYNQLPSGIYPE